MNSDTRESVRRHFDRIAVRYDYWKKKNWYYHESLKAFLRRHVRPGSAVLEIGCATGDILASLKPALGVGIDLSREMIRLAREKFPAYRFECAAAEEFQCADTFDYIVMVDVLDHVIDIITVLEAVRRWCHPGTKIIVTTINPWWEPLLWFMEKLGGKMPEGPHNFIERRNLAKMVELLDVGIDRSGYLLLCPVAVPFVAWLMNTLGVRLWGLNKFSFVHYAVLRPVPAATTDLGYGCSVVIPCHNEEDNIAAAVRRVPPLGTGTEIIVVNDGSTDATAAVVRGLQRELKNLTLVEQPRNLGKGAAVKAGFDRAAQEILMILDADMSVPPEELPRFFKLLNQGRCDFVNGTRMIYPMQRQAMRFLNLLGNKVFGLLMTFITGQHLTDTLCGTKALYRKDYRHIRMGRDRWGDFDLLFGAALQGSRIMELPVHYMTRTAGESKMHTLRHGLHLAAVCARGFRELLFAGEPAKSQPRGK